MLGSATLKSAPFIIPITKAGLDIAKAAPGWLLTGGILSGMGAGIGGATYSIYGAAQRAASPGCHGILEESNEDAVVEVPDSNSPHAQHT